MKKRVLVVGHSHLGALQWYHDTAGEQLTFDVDFVQLLSKEFDPAQNSGADEYLSQTLRDRAQQCDLAIFSVSGNEHQVMGLINHPRPFDFTLPQHPDLPLLQDREIIPFPLIEQALASWMRADLFRKYSAMVSLPKFQLEPPPPILDHEHIKKYPGVFGEKIQELGINNPVVRFKLWRLASAITEKICLSFGIGYVPAPAEAIGPEGYLHYRALIGDPTHANGWYGGFVMKQIEGLLNGSVKP